MKNLAKYFPWAVVAVFVLYAAGKMYPSREVYKDYDLSAFGAIPVLDGGRIKPLDSIARSNMLLIRGTSEFEDREGNTQPAILWLLEILAAGDPNASPMADYEIFRIDNEQLLAELGLREKPGLRYSWNDIRKTADRFDRLYIAARTKEDKKERGEKVPEAASDLLHGKVLELGRRLHAYEQLASRDAVTLIPKEKGSKVWFTLAEIDDLAGQPFADDVRRQVVNDLVAEMQAKGMRPEDLPDGVLRREVSRRTKVQLRVLGEHERKSVSPAAAAFGDILVAYQGHRPNAFAEAIAAYRADYIEPLNPEFRDTTKFEVAFNAAAPFFVAALMYIFAGVFEAFSWLGFSGPLRKTAMGLALFALSLHVVALFSRMYLMGRPLVFVTNLYSSALLIGAGAVAACLYLEHLFKNGVGLVVGTTVGAVTVKIAHHLTLDGSDTLGNLVAVLDTNFWLASHVTTVTLGYAATYVAGLLGVAYIAWGLFFTTLSKEKHTAVGNMIYGVTCFATMLSFIGTVLGGIWADQSWGRFWGWDPKENGAVLIVIWNALILHARWGGLVKQRGMAVLAVVGIMVTTWSWFGTNQLGVGLHNYGFNKSLADGCRYTWLACLAIIGLGSIPLKYWRSFAGTGLPKPETVTVSLAQPVAQPQYQGIDPNFKHAKPTTEGENGQVPNGQPQPNGHPKPGSGKGKKHGKKR